MNTILIVGAGKSSAYLIENLLHSAQQENHNWKVIIADSDEAILKHKVRNYPDAEIAVLDINNEAVRQKLVKRATIVVSLMPPQLHILLAKDCLLFKKNLITSSYASDEMKMLDAAAKEAGLMFMCEMGLDPGIDHMTASQIFDSVREQGGVVTSFKSYCGGLIAPESDNNPWHYKFSWNPKNIINAGKDGAHYLQAGQQIHVPYHQMFAHNETIFCAGAGHLAYYPNRDSLSYIDLFHLPNVSDFMRATLRHPDFSLGWNTLVAMGITNTELHIDTAGMSYKDWIKQVVGYEDNTISVAAFAWKKFNVVPQVQQMIEWLGVFSDEKIPAEHTTSGDILLDILSIKWKMQPEDKDMVVMQHEIEYQYEGHTKRLISSMVVLGENSEFSAMAKTVGTPMAILTALVLQNEIVPPTGVHIPTMPEVYIPILQQLQASGISFTDTLYVV